MRIDQSGNDSAARTPIGDRVTIYRRGRKGTYVAEFHFDGDHRRRSLKTANKKIAIERATRLAAELSDGSFKRNPPAVSITDAVERYLGYLATESRARRTCVRYRGELIRFADFAREHHVVGLDRVTPSLLDLYRSDRKAVVSDTTLAHEGVVIKQFFKWARSRHMIRENPVADYRIAKPVRSRKPVPTLEQVNAVLARCSSRLANLITMSSFTGMRSGELQGLHKADVYLDAGFVHVHRQIEGPTKTRTERRIPIHPRIRPVLKQLVDADQHELLVTSQASERYPGGGRPISTKRLNEEFQAAAKRAGITGFSVHSLRHFFNTFCVNAGIPERVVRAWMGHGDRSMTGVYYSLSDEESLRFMNQVPFGTAIAGDTGRGVPT